MTRRRVLLIGATGVFGRRLARHLSRISDLDLVLTSRDRLKAAALADSIIPVADTTIRGIALDHRAGLTQALASLSPWLVIDASGPFQGADYDVPRAALEAGAHVVDLADARDYILGYGPALDALARERGLVALTGASSSPALSTAAVVALTEGWWRVDTVDIAITPGGRSEVGPAVVAAVLSYAGRPVPVWRDGALSCGTGWLDGRLMTMPGLGRRRVGLVETVDAEWLGPGLPAAARVNFHAGLESSLERRGIAALAWLRSRGLIGRIDGLVPILLAARNLTRLTTSDRGGMLIEVTGLDGEQGLTTARWSLLAERGDGPHVPTLAAAAALRALMADRIPAGARPAAGVLSLSEIEAEAEPYAITTRRDVRRHGAGVFLRALGEAGFRSLPAPLQLLHRSDGPPVWRGSAEVATGGALARWLGRLLGFPPAGREVPLTVTIERLMAPDGPCEIWTRDFGGSRFSSRLRSDDTGLIHERIGPAEIALKPGREGDSLALPAIAGRIGPLRWPRFLLPRSQAREYADTEGRFHFDVKLTLPVLGLLVHYRGWLVPDGPEADSSGALRSARSAPASPVWPETTPPA